MFIIFIAHTPGNSWNDWIPARFGFSSGTELFVFCSGFASAGAFGRVFQTHGWFLASAKVWKRIWQIYWVQMCMVLASLAIASAFHAVVGPSAIERFAPITSEGVRALFALMTLQWLPDFLDILPMYMVILILLPVAEFLTRWHSWLPLLASFLLWLGVQIFGFNLSGNPWAEDGWFLNPFAWQFCFMLGYSFGLKRLKPPALGRPFLMVVASFFLLISFFFSYQPLVDTFFILREVQELILPAQAKTNLAPIRMVHFLVLAYVIVSLVTPYAMRLDQGLSAPFVMIGRQSLAAFVASILCAEICGFLLQVWGRGASAMMAINLIGLVTLLITARLVSWFKREPWARRAGHH